MQSQSELANTTYCNIHYISVSKQTPKIVFLAYFESQLDTLTKNHDHSVYICLFTKRRQSKKSSKIAPIRPKYLFSYTKLHIQIQQYCQIFDKK